MREVPKRVERGGQKRCRAMHVHQVSNIDPEQQSQKHMHPPLAARHEQALHWKRKAREVYTGQRSGRALFS